MKYPTTLRPQLIADVLAVAKMLAKSNNCTVEHALQNAAATIFIREVNAQRSFTDDHPRWHNLTRVLSPSHVDSQSWLTELYDIHGLNDATLTTAVVWAQARALKQLKTPAIIAPRRAARLKDLLTLKDVSEETAKDIRLEWHTNPDRHQAMRAIDAMLNTFGVEEIPPSEAKHGRIVHYCNAGDSYAPTLIFVGGAMRVACWADYVLGA